MGPLQNLENQNQDQCSTFGPINDPKKSKGQDQNHQQNQKHNQTKTNLETEQKTNHKRKRNEKDHIIDPTPSKRPNI